MKKALIALLIVFSLVLVACGNDKNSTNSVENSIENIATTLPDTDNDKTTEESTETDNVSGSGQETSSETSSDTEEEEEVDTEGKIFSKLTGLEITEEQSKKRPIAVMLDNHYKARPQAGLSDAEVVYEVLAEGFITRYMAIFQAHEPSVIGPVRSARPYYIERALEFKPLYVHVGGSMQALTNIINFNMADIDGLSVGAGVFNRTSHKKMPHNAYSNHDGIRKEADRKGYFTEVDFAGMPISHTSYDLEGQEANHVSIQYKKSSASDSIGYSVAFRYDPEEKNYLRYVNGAEHLDEETKIHLRADNIIIQQAKHKTLDSAGRREITMVGSGSGYYVNKGMYVPITWKKKDLYSQTQYYFENGEELILNPGITWVQVVKTSTEPYIE